MRAFRIAYDGRPFYGFQRQPEVRTVEGAILDACRDLGIADDDETPPGYAAAGRTDAGVSALAQTVAFDCPDWCTPRALNGALPTSVRAYAASDVPADFHATHDATSRTYVYHLYAPRVGDERGDATAYDPVDDYRWLYPPVDDDLIDATVARLQGERDFHNLTPDERNTVRDLSISVRRDGPVLVFTLSAPGFARELVRRVVGLVRDVGAGDHPLSHVERVLGSDPVDGAEGIAPAPPEPLVLTDVTYPDVSFAADADAVAMARRAFALRRVDGLLASRVAGDVARGVVDADSDS